jgi:small subunit ribosomal protein S20
MANTKSSAKRARQTQIRTLVNRRGLTAVKTQLKNVREALKSGKKAEAQAAAHLFISTIDKAAKTGRVHRNSANRHKASVAKALAALPNA